MNGAISTLDEAAVSFFRTSRAQANVASRLVSIQFERWNLCAVIQEMRTITEAEFERIVTGIQDDADLIVKHNPFGSRDEILLWMLMSCLISYLSLSELETPCFTGKPDAETYRDAIRFVLRDRKAADFDAEVYLDKLFEA